MKPNPLDILIVLFMIVVALITFFLVASIVPFTIEWLGDYHSVVDILLFLLGFGILSALLIRIVLVFWPLRPGSYSWEQAHASHWKLFALTYMFGRGALLPFTPDLFNPFVARLFGAKIGKGVVIGGVVNEPPLVSIGDYAILGQYSVVTPHAITSGKIILGKVTIGNNVTIGVGSFIMPGVEIGDGAMVMPNTFVPMNTKILTGEIWGGNPIAKIQDAPAR